MRDGLALAAALAGLGAFTWRARWLWPAHGAEKLLALACEQLSLAKSAGGGVGDAARRHAAQTDAAIEPALREHAARPAPATAGSAGGLSGRVQRARDAVT